MPAEVKEFKGTKTVAVDPRKQYVAGGHLYAATGGTRTLSGVSEDVTHAHSAKTYEQMYKADPKVSKAINFLKVSVLAENVEFRPSLSEKDPNYAEAEALALFCKKAIKSLETPLKYVLEQMMDALVYGHKIAEVTYKTTELSGFEGTFLVPHIIKVKQLDAVQFVVDDKMNVIGFAVRNLNQGARDAVKISRGKSNEALINGRVILPREKFMVLTIRGEDGDPRGRSILASAVQAWHMKVQSWPEYLKYLMLCAIPLLVGTTPENDTGVKEILRGADGQPIKDPITGSFIEANPVEALRDAMLMARNGEVLAAKGGTKISEIGGQGAGTPFFKAVELFDSQMETGILMQTLATSEGVHQSRAASTMHMTVLDQLVYWFKGVVVDMLLSDLLRPMVRYNFGDDALEFMPKLSLGDTERREFAVDGVTIATLAKAGYFTPEQYRQADEILGFEPRETARPEQLIQQLQDAGVPIVAVPPPPDLQATIQSGPGGGNTPVPINPPKDTEGVTKTGNVPSQVAKRAVGAGAKVKFPATGRIRRQLNKAPKNAEIGDTTQLSKDEEDYE